MEKIKHTSGRDKLGEFAPEFAHFNDDILFGENWNNNDIDLKTRCIIKVVHLVSMGNIDSSLEYHLLNCKKYGITQKEIKGIITHIAFYVGWPKVWAAFNMAKKLVRINQDNLPPIVFEDYFFNSIIILVVKWKLKKDILNI